MPNPLPQLSPRPGGEPGLGVSPAHLDWLAGLVDQGLCLALGPQRYRLRLSQAALARHMGMSPGSGTLSRRLRELADAGVVLSRRPLVFQLPATPADGGPADRSVDRPADGPAGGPVGEPASEPADFLLTTLLSLCTEAMTARSDDVVLAVLGCLDQALARRGSGADLARTPRGSSSNFSGSTSPRWTGADRVTAAPPRALVGPVTTTADGSRLDARRAAEVMYAVEPLLDACRRLGLPGVTNPRGLLDAVSDVTLDDLHHGACLVAQQLSQNVTLRSPVGVLIALARRGELAGLSGFALGSPTQRLSPDVTAPDAAAPQDTVTPSLPSVADPWWDELSRLEREDPEALCDLTGDVEPWLAKIRAYPRNTRAAASGIAAAPPDGERGDIDNPPRT